MAQILSGSMGAIGGIDVPDIHRLHLQVKPYAKIFYPRRLATEISNVITACRGEKFFAPTINNVNVK
jgi:hypothetical protein